MHRRTPWAVALAMMLSAGCPALGGGFVISDRSFFDRIPHTLIDFETRYDGTPVIVDEGQITGMPNSHYATLGVLIFGQPGWANLTSDDLEAIQAEHASPHNSLAMGAVFLGDPVGFSFFPHVRSWGIFIMIDVSVPTLRPEFAIGRSGEIFTTLTFDESFVQGRVGDIEYGFIGYADEEPFSAVVMRNFTRPVFDDLRFSAIPAPGAGVALGIAGLGALARRRR